MSGSKLKRLIGMEEETHYLQEMCKYTLLYTDYFYKHANIFCKLSGISSESFMNRITNIKNEVNEIMKHCRPKDINKIKMLNDWFAEQDTLLDTHLLHPMDQQC